MIDKTEWILNSIDDSPEYADKVRFLIEYIENNGVIETITKVIEVYNSLKEYKRLSGML